MPLYSSVACVATAAAAGWFIFLPPSPNGACLYAGDTQGLGGEVRRVRCGRAPACPQGAGPCPDVGGLHAWPLGPSALHGAPPARPAPNPGAVGLRFPASRPRGCSGGVRSAVAEQNTRSGSETYAAEDPGQEELVRGALRRRRRGRGREVQRSVGHRPGRGRARLPRLHQRTRRSLDRRKTCPGVPQIITRRQRGGTMMDDLSECKLLSRRSVISNRALRYCLQWRVKLRSLLG